MLTVGHFFVHFFKGALHSSCYFTFFGAHDQYNVIVKHEFRDGTQFEATNRTSRIFTFVTITIQLKRELWRRRPKLVLATWCVLVVSVISRVWKSPE